MAENNGSSVATLDASDTTCTETDEVCVDIVPNEADAPLGDFVPDASEDVQEEDPSLELPTQDEGDEGKSFSEEMTNPDKWVGSDPLKNDYLAIKKQAEELFGHKTKIMKYVTFMYLVRAVMLKEAKWCSQRDEQFKRADFIKKIRDFLLFTSSIPKGQIEPSAWLQMVGFMELFRATVDDATGRYVFPQSPPDEHFFAGNLCYSTLRALAPLVRVEKVQGASDSYSWVEGGVEVAKDMVKGLRNCSIPNSVSYVIARRDALLTKALAALEGKKRAAMNEEELRRHLRRERDKLEDARDAKLKNAVKALEKVVEENKFSLDTVKSALAKKDLIEPLGTSDLVGLMAAESSRKIAMAALLGNVETRKALIESLALDLTHQDVQHLANNLMARHVKAKGLDAGAKQAIESWRAAAAKFQPQQQKLAS